MADPVPDPDAGSLSIVLHYTTTTASDETAAILGRDAARQLAQMVGGGAHVEYAADGDLSADVTNDAAVLADLQEAAESEPADVAALSTAVDAVDLTDASEPLSDFVAALIVVLDALAA